MATVRTGKAALTLQFCNAASTGIFLCFLLCRTFYRLFLFFNSFQKCPLQIFFPYLDTRCCFFSKHTQYFSLQNCQSNSLTWTYLYIVKASKAFLCGMWLQRGSPIRWEPIKPDFPSYLIGHTYRNFQWKPPDYLSFGSLLCFSCLH